MKALEFFVIFVLMPLLGAWTVYALTILWAWFITPQFGLAVPSFATMWGLLLTFQMVRGYQHSDEPLNGEMLVGAVTYPAMALAFGWSIKYLGAVMSEPISRLLYLPKNHNYRLAEIAKPEAYAAKLRELLAEVDHMEQSLISLGYEVKLTMKGSPTTSGAMPMSAALITNIEQL